MSTLSDDLLKLSNLASLKNIISAFLLKRSPASIYSLSDLQAYAGQFDFTSDTTLVDADLVGLKYYTGITKLVLPNTTTPFTAASVDVSALVNCVDLVSLNGSNCPFYGDISARTNFKSISSSFDALSIRLLKMPAIGANTQLVTFYANGNQINWGSSVLGNLQNLTALTTFTLTFATSVSQSVINNILSTLKTAKQNGGALTTVNLTGSTAPTGGNAGNTDAIALRGLGVTVTTAG